MWLLCKIWGSCCGAAEGSHLGCDTVPLGLQLLTFGMVLHKTANYTPNDKASHPTRRKSRQLLHQSYRGKPHAWCKWQTRGLPHSASRPLWATSTIRKCLSVPKIVIKIPVNRRPTRWTGYRKYTGTWTEMWRGSINRSYFFLSDTDGNMVLNFWRSVLLALIIINGWIALKKGKVSGKGTEIFVFLCVFKKKMWKTYLLNKNGHAVWGVSTNFLAQ
jgi:hypothetical protein